MEGPQGYGRTAADDAGFEAAFLAKELGRPVRVQWMRDEETTWDTKGPAYAMRLRGGLDAQGRLVALDVCVQYRCNLEFGERDLRCKPVLNGIGLPPVGTELPR